MQQIEKVVIPLSIGAAVLGVWAALRNRGTTPIVVQDNSGIQPPGAVPPLEQTLVDPSSGVGSGAGNGLGVSPSYVNAQDPTSQYPIQVPGTPQMMNGTGLQGTPTYLNDYADAILPQSYIGALPPWKNGVISSLARAAGLDGLAASTCECGGSCNGSCGSSCGGSGGKQRCPTSRQCNSLLDGGGAPFVPLYQKPKAPPGLFGNVLVYSVETQRQVATPAGQPASIDHISYNM